MRRSFTYLLALVVCLQTSCSAPVRPENLGQLDKSSLGHVAVVAARFDPEYHFESLATGKGDAAAQGAGGGAMSCGQFFSYGGSGLGAIGAALAFLVCLPVAATVGAIYGASHAAPAQQIEDAKAAAQRGTAALMLQEDAVEAAVRYAQAVGLDLGRLAQEMGPASTEDFPSYTGARGTADTVIEISVLRANASTTGSRELRVSLGIQARVRVLSARDGNVTNTLSVKYSSEPRAIDEWLAADGREIKAAFARGSASIAEQAIDEILLIYDPVPPADTSPGETQGLAWMDSHADTPPPRPVETGRVPPYALRVIEPPIRSEIYLGSRRTYGALERYQLGELQPSFRWEAWPRGFDVVPGNGPSQAQQVRYDLRIFGQPGIVYERRGLVDAEHRLEQPLEPCHTYRWTVRARFMLNGAPRATEWTGAYAEYFPPWWWRRGSGFLLPAAPSVDWFYPIVETPSSDGKTCPDR